MSTKLPRTEDAAQTMKNSTITASSQNREGHKSSIDTSFTYHYLLQHSIHFPQLIPVILSSSDTGASIWNGMV
jgi:hypothetical protein